MILVQIGKGQDNEKSDPQSLEHYFSIESPDTIQMQNFKSDYIQLLQKRIKNTIHWSDSIYRALNDSILLINSNFTYTMGEALDSLMQYVLADKYFQVAIAQLEQTGNTSELLAVKYRWSLNLYRQSRFSEALALFDDMLRIAQSENLEAYEAKAHYGKGNVYYGLTNYKKAITELIASINICEKIHMTGLMALNYKTLGNCYHLMAEPTKAISYHKKALTLQDSSQMAWTYVELSNDYSWDQSYIDSVWYYAEKAIIMSGKYDNEFFKLLSYRNMISICYHTGRLDSCISYSDTAISIAKKLHDISSIAEIYKLLSTVFYHKEDYKLALRYYHTYFLYYDSLMVQNANFNFNLEQNLINSAIRNKEISDLSTITEEQGTIIKRTQILLGIAILLLIAAITTYYITRLLNQKRVSELKHKLTRFQMNPHFIFNSLNSLQTFVLENDVKSANKYLSVFSQLMRLTLENSYHNEVPITQEISQLELYLSLESMRFDHKFKYSINISPDVDENHIKIPSLLIQPFVENAIWHGLLNKTEGEKRLVIHIGKEGNQIICRVEDNGIGRTKALEIKSKSKSSHKSLGTKITQQRLELLSAIHGKNFRISYEDLFNKSGIPEGTRVHIYLPMVLN